MEVNIRSRVIQLQSITFHVQRPVHRGISSDVSRASDMKFSIRRLCTNAEIISRGDVKITISAEFRYTG